MTQSRLSAFAKEKPLSEDLIHHVLYCPPLIFLNLTLPSLSLIQELSNRVPSQSTQPFFHLYVHLQTRSELSQSVDDDKLLFTRELYLQNTRLSAPSSRVPATRGISGLTCFSRVTSPYPEDLVRSESSTHDDRNALLCSRTCRYIILSASFLRTDHIGRCLHISSSAFKLSSNRVSLTHPFFTSVSASADFF